MTNATDKILREPEWPRRDKRALHGLAGRIVKAMAPHTEADPAALLVTDVSEAKAEFQVAVYKTLSETLGVVNANRSDRFDQLFERELVRTVESLANQDIQTIERGPDRAA